MKIEKGEDSAFISETADWFTPFGGPVQFKKFDESPALVAPHQIPYPSVPPLFRQDRVILNT